MDKASTSVDWATELTIALRDGLTVRELGDKLGVTTSAVHKHERRTGIRLKRIRSVTPHKGNSSEIDWPTILSQALSTDMSTTALASSLGVSLAAVLAAEDRTRIYLRRRRPDPRRIGSFRSSSDTAE